MSKKINLLIILALPILLCGCTVDYDIKINKDLSVDESFTVVEEREKIKEQSYVNTYSELVDSVKSNTGVDSSKYEISEYKKGSLLGSKIHRSYPTIEKYVYSVNNYDLFTTKTSYTNKGGIYTFNSKILYESNEEFVAITYFIDAKINIKVPFEVIESNADYVDKKNNIYSWDLKNYKKSEKTEDIKLVFDTNKKISSISDYYIYFAIGIVLVAFIIVCTVVYKKSNKTLEI